MQKILIRTLLLLLVVTSATAQPSFQPGQKWSIQGSTMTIVVGMVEPFGKRTAVSVSVLGVPCPPGAGCTQITVAHAPFDSIALAQSVETLLDSQAPTAPQFREGYKNWKDAQGGIYTIPMQQLPEILFKALSADTPSKTP